MFFKLLRYNFRRLHDSKKLYLYLFLDVLVIIAGFAFTFAYNPGSQDGYIIILGIYTAIVQFTWLICAYPIASLFSSDKEKGVDNFFKQLGFSKVTQILCSLACAFVLFCFVPSLLYCVCAFMFSVAGDIRVLKCLILLVTALLQTVSVGAFVSIVFKKTSFATLSMYAAYLVFTIVNIASYGFTIQCDSNSISTHAANLLITGMGNGSSTNLFNSSFTANEAFMIGIICSLVSSLVLIVLSFVISKVRHIDKV